MRKTVSRSGFQATATRIVFSIVIALIPVLLGLVAARIGFASSVDPTVVSDDRRPTLSKEEKVATGRWLIPDAEYVKLHPPPRISGEDPRSTKFPQHSQQADGPAARRLLSLILASGSAYPVLTGLQPSSVVDQRSSGVPVAGTVSFNLSDGRIISASQQQLVKPLPHSAVRIGADSEIMTWNTGTVAVVIVGLSSIQVLMVTHEGLMTQITARGVLANGIQPPLDKTQMLELAVSVDALIAQGK